MISPFVCLALSFLCFYDLIRDIPSSGSCFIGLYLGGIRSSGLYYLLAGGEGCCNVCWGLGWHSHSYSYPIMLVGVIVISFFSLCVLCFGFGVVVLC